MWTQICKSRTLAIWWVRNNYKNSSSHRIDADNVRVFLRPFFFATCQKQRGRRILAAISIWKCGIHKVVNISQMFCFWQQHYIFIWLLLLVPFVNVNSSTKRSLKNAARGVSLLRFGKLWKLLAFYAMRVMLTHVSNIYGVVVDTSKMQLNCAAQLLLQFLMQYKWQF